jgi:hypothetical protein
LGLSDQHYYQASFDSFFSHILLFGLNDRDNEASNKIETIVPGPFAKILIQLLKLFNRLGVHFPAAALFPGV